MKRMVPVLALFAVLTASGCFAPEAQVVARNWRPLGPRGLTLGQLLAVSPNVKGVVWETFAGEPGQTVARASVEYHPDAAAAGCPALGKGMTLAARVFLILDLAVTKADGTVTFLAAKAQAYNADGYFEEYWLDMGVMAALASKTFPLPCADLGVPAYLR